MRLEGGHSCSPSVLHSTSDPGIPIKSLQFLSVCSKRVDAPARRRTYSKQTRAKHLESVRKVIHFEQSLRSIRRIDASLRTANRTVRGSVVPISNRSHDRPGQTVYDWRHYLAVVQRKPGALRNGAPFIELPDAFRTLQQYLLKKPGGDREMVDILALVLQHDEQAVLSAVDMALKSGVPTKTHVLNLLHRLVDGKSFTPPTLDAPQALTLTNEPKANVERYDTLRKTEARHAS